MRKVAPVSNGGAPSPIEITKEQPLYHRRSIPPEAKRVQVFLDEAFSDWPASLGWQVVPSTTHVFDLCALEVQVEENVLVAGRFEEPLLVPLRHVVMIAVGRVRVGPTRRPCRATDPPNHARTIERNRDGADI
jgi:hypothetical protein